MARLCYPVTLSDYVQQCTPLHQMRKVYTWFMHVYTTLSLRCKHWCSAHNIHMYNGDTWTALGQVQTTVTAASGNRDAEGSSGELLDSELSKYIDRKSIIFLYKIRQIPETSTSVAV